MRESNILIESIIIREIIKVMKPCNDLVEAITYKLSGSRDSINIFFNIFLFSNSFTKTATDPMAVKTEEKLGLPKNPVVPELVLTHGKGSKLNFCNKL
jgi:hypothetical protein